MSTIKLTDRISLTTDRAESNYGRPALIIDGRAYGADEDYGVALWEALGQPRGQVGLIIAAHSGYQFLPGLCKTPQAKAMLKAFSPGDLDQPDGE